MDKENQIKELDSLIRKRIGRQYVYKPNFDKYGEKDGYIAVFTSDIAKDLYNAGYQKIDNGSEVVDRKVLEMFQKDEERFREKAKFYYEKCKSYGIENFYDAELEYVDD